MSRFPFTPEEQKNAIKKRVEAGSGCMLEDLIVGAWLVYGLTHGNPDDEIHILSKGIINTFELHRFGWSTSWLIPNSMTLEGDDATLDERITEYCDAARKHKDEIHKSLVMMITTVKIYAGGNEEDLMYQWAINAQNRHHMSLDDPPAAGMDVPNFVPPKNKTVQ